MSRSIVPLTLCLLLSGGLVIFGCQDSESTAADKNLSRARESARAELHKAESYMTDMIAQLPAGTDPAAFERRMESFMKSDLYGSSAFELRRRPFEQFEKLPESAPAASRVGRPGRVPAPSDVERDIDENLSKSEISRIELLAPLEVNRKALGHIEKACKILQQALRENTAAQPGSKMVAQLLAARAEIAWGDYQHFQARNYMTMAYQEILEAEKIVGQMETLARQVPYYRSMLQLAPGDYIELRTVVNADGSKTYSSKIINGGDEPMGPLYEEQDRGAGKVIIRRLKSINEIRREAQKVTSVYREKKTTLTSTLAKLRQDEKSLAARHATAKAAAATKRAEGRNTPGMEGLKIHREAMQMQEKVDQMEADLLKLRYDIRSTELALGDTNLILDEAEARLAELTAKPTQVTVPDNGGTKTVTKMGVIPATEAEKKLATQKINELFQGQTVTDANGREVRVLGLNDYQQQLAGRIDRIAKLFAEAKAALVDKGKSHYELAIDQIAAAIRSGREARMRRADMAELLCQQGDVYMRRGRSGTMQVQIRMRTDSLAGRIEALIRKLPDEVKAPAALESVRGLMLNNDGEMTAALNNYRKAATQYDAALRDVRAGSVTSWTYNGLIATARLGEYGLLKSDRASTSADRMKVLQEAQGSLRTALDGREQSPNLDDLRRLNRQVQLLIGMESGTATRTGN